MSRKELSIEGAVTLAEAISYIEKIVSGIKNGVLTVSNKDESITITPENEVYFAVDTIQRKKEEQISITLFWSKNDDGEKQPLDLSISTQKTESLSKPKNKKKNTANPAKSK